MTDRRPTAMDKAKKQWEVMALNALLIFFMNFAIFLSVPPQIKIFEDIICRKIHLDNALNLHPGDDDSCRGALVQTELARINGWKTTFEALPSIWSDVLPLRLVWLSGLLRSIGGGEPVIDSIMAVMVMDVFEERDRDTVTLLTLLILSAVALLRLHSVFIVAKILAAPTSAAVVALGSPWTPFMLSLVILSAAQVLSFLLPETLGYAEPQEPDDNRTRRSITEKKGNLIQKFALSAKFVVQNPNMVPIIIVNLVASITKSSSNFLLQYSSTRYGWSYSLSSLVLMIREASSLITYLVLTPAASAAIRRIGRGSVTAQDKRLCQAGGLLNVFGYFSIATAATPVLFMLALAFLSLGSGFDTVVTSFATSLVQPHQIVSLHLVAATAKSIGGLVGGPLFARLMQVGFELGSGWLGMPYIAAGLFFFAVLLALSSIRIQSRNLDETEQPLLPTDV
ncbi:uncharacterized protein N7515_000705 [Penicillium bovifimosum]|uniref:Major facilitator superfamily (MFS) profile domain-containing protein n=1 Tax=Penicillium bovifimosum TaxID=126998 RepID=A0A9W9LBP8_9EURO|nr:uncharacterized protein N7515_000705 [Penicillium bovifimosum]KAJ5146141.1 hypothetical protein N7515_000705 [Penicillium bovifimosum]